MSLEVCTSATPDTVGMDPGRAPTSLCAISGLVDEMRSKLGDARQSDGHWVFELEADATIPAEYILYRHFLGDPADEEIECKIGKYLRRMQNEDGGWPLFHDGDFDMSATVKAYFALKVIGDDVNAPHMAKARATVLAHGGAEKSNVFTRILLALYGQVPWRAVPVMPVEIMLLPWWFPFHMSKVSYWSRTVIAPLLVLISQKPKAKNPRGTHIGELFVTPPEKAKQYHVNSTGSFAGACLIVIDRCLRVIEPRFSKKRRAKALCKAKEFMLERLNGEYGIGAIFPAMINAVKAMTVLGMPEDDSSLVKAKAAIEKLLVIKEEEAYCQPCVSPVWDTSLAGYAMLETGIEPNGEVMVRAADWLLNVEINDFKGDWAWQNPGLKPGGWAFQYRNKHYPDADDTAVVGMMLHRQGNPKYAGAIKRAEDWIVGMQSSNGGWGAFDINNDKHYLNDIPFADHGALLDPPTSDVSARCLSFLAQIGYSGENPIVKKALMFLKDEQENDGSWFGRWGINYIYGTWSVLSALNAIGEDMQQPYVRKAINWLKSRQNEDGGWGEDGTTYWRERRTESKASTPSQTSWALLTLMAAGDVSDIAVDKGVRYLMNTPRRGARWEEEHYSAVGFPRVFYLRYHGYAAYFPLWALARYRNLKRANDQRVKWGM